MGELSEREKIAVAALNKIVNGKEVPLPGGGFVGGEPVTHVVDLSPAEIEDLVNTALNALQAEEARPRTEGRGEGEPVAWAYEYTNHLKGDRAPGGWLRAVAFEAPTRARVNAGFARNVQPLYASPIREPEISRTKRDEIARIIDPEIFSDLDLTASQAPQFIPTYSGQRTVDAALAKADAILNLAPVGGRGDD